MNGIKGLTLSELAARYPAYDTAEIDRILIPALKSLDRQFIVLDDDPTGIQTVYDVAVLTVWDTESIAAEMRGEGTMFFILTNSRSLSHDDTKELHRTIARNIAEASKLTGRDYILVSRGDSTLRGHYPAETETLRRVTEEMLEIPVDGEIICPFFPEGGRYTADDIHFLEENGKLLPVGESEFARDKTFGYTSSNLKDWVAEKTGGTFGAGDVVSVSIDELRREDYRAITEKLTGLSGFRKLIVNALDYDDIKVFVISFIQAAASGKRYILRSAAGILKVLLGKPGRPLLGGAELRSGSSRGGIIIAGSHVSKTTRQLEKLKELPDVVFLELNQHLALDSAAFAGEISRVQNLAEKEIEAGRTAVIQTRRERFDLNTGNREDELRLAVTISDGLTGIVANLRTAPGFIIAKGGITSSDVGTKGLKVRRAMVMGQILPGIPVWKTGPESRFPGIAYVIFPGNVGSDNALKEAVEKLRG
ncbi:four-carbon acid sugar kinase family protein [Breznakiella homolactica]|uniref:Hydroxyacid dehydrogenase n=1 Tax=Breznakiella homolactica TaxID=2798577 RepID=A0A7T7XKD8_9SPIR|nr:four-carbon acid sugar kinase family protein [Breznakiella homolactica]QQO07915.1 hydroxyacid dehydrogenase [Breznakiella homolactica]